ncbi:helix-turn-helix domain-containing protein [Nonomuraea sp. NPDC052265]|uniref:helix-turn-helix domain-containing protein n=1 Tax=Nonomuraea sp. NPDC052265 TaxID=3364374 RepID=UPI0037CAC1A0
MLEQPSFGLRLRQLRTDRGLSQTALAGDGMSTGYLSRLESGARQPTERAVTYLADRLGISPAEFAEPATASLAQSLTLAAGLDVDATGELLAEAVKVTHEQDPLLRWQALWRIAEWRRRHLQYAEEHTHLRELVDVSEQIRIPELSVRALAQLARCLRALGEISAALEAAAAAHQQAVQAGLSTHARANALLALVSAESEAGRLPDARAHADELTALVAGRTDTLWAETMWTGAAVLFRQGDSERAGALLDEALERFDGRENLDLWLRLRTAAAALHLRKSPPDLDRALACVQAIEPALPFAGTPALEQAVMSLRAQIAFQRGELGQARQLLDRLDSAELRMSHREQVRLEILRHQLLIAEGREEEGLAGMRALAQQAQEEANIDLAAEIWRLTAESLTQSHDRAPA